jgi:uncharacterized membrane protein YfcA
MTLFDLILAYVCFGAAILLLGWYRMWRDRQNLFDKIDQDAGDVSPAVRALALLISLVVGAVYSLFFWPLLIAEKLKKKSR